MSRKYVFHRIRLGLGGNGVNMFGEPPNLRLMRWAFRSILDARSSRWLS